MVFVHGYKILMCRDNFSIILFADDMILVVNSGSKLFLDHSPISHVINLMKIIKINSKHILHCM